MTWNNSQVIRLIKDRSSSLREVLNTRRPLPPSDNPLYEDRISKDQILLRRKLDEIQGDDSSDSLVGSIASAVEIGSSVKPIPADHEYSEEDIEEYLEYKRKEEIWFDRERNMNNQYGLEIEPFSVVYDKERSNYSLVFSGGEYLTSIGVDETSRVRGRELRNSTYHIGCVTNEEIDEFLENVQFDGLRLRLLDSGYPQLVNDITEALEQY